MSVVSVMGVMRGLFSNKNISRDDKHIQYLERCVSYDCGECYNGVWLNRNEWLRRKANSYLINVMLLMLMLLWLEFFSSKKQYDNVSTQCYESCGCYECYQRWYNGENISLLVRMYSALSVVSVVSVSMWSA